MVALFFSDYGMKADDMFLDTYLSTAVDMLPFMALPVD